MIATGIVSKNSSNQLIITDNFYRLSRNPLFSLSLNRQTSKSKAKLNSPKNIYTDYMSLKSLLIKKEEEMEEKRKKMIDLRRKLFLIENNCNRNYFKKQQGEMID